jgi:hypothetical protein
VAGLPAYFLPKQRARDAMFLAEINNPAFCQSMHDIVLVITSVVFS